MPRSRSRSVAVAVAVTVAVAVALVLGTSGRAGAAPAGWKFHQGEPGKPRVLLIHGLAASSRDWTDPASGWSIKGAHFDHRTPVKAKSGRSEVPRVGLHSFALSPEDPRAGAAGSFWAYLVGKGYTVATWDQAPCMDAGPRPSRACLDGDTFDAAYLSAREALGELARQGDVKTPIALIGHSRGGLLARRLLKEEGQAGRERVRWLITLHTPHQGSGMASLGVAMQQKLKRVDGAVSLDFLPRALREAARALVPDAVGALGGAIELLMDISGMEGARELAAGGATLAALGAGETKRPGVRVVTFGGTSPRVVRIHAWVYTPAGAVPTSKGYPWRAVPRQVLDFPGDLQVPFDEMKSGGDLLVTDRSAHLPFEDLHIKHALNHAEVLWSRDVEGEVDRELQVVPAKD